MARRYALRDDQWARIAPLLPGRAGHVGGTAADNRLFVEAVLYRYRAGLPWRDLPERFGRWKSVYQRFDRWAKAGVWERVFAALSADADDEYAMLDSTIVRAHQHAAGARKRGRRRGPRAGAGRAEHQDPRPGRRARQPGRLPPDRRAGARPRRGGRSPAEARVLAVLRAAGVEAVIPPKRTRTAPRDYDRDRYAARALIEHFFGKLKQFRAIATRYDKTKRNFQAGIYAAATTILLN